jgi:hypothetical protein
VISPTVNVLNITVNSLGLSGQFFSASKLTTEEIIPREFSLLLSDNCLSLV